MSGKELLKLVQKQGWVLERINGSHHILIHPNKTEQIVIPVHGKKEVAKGTENQILKKAGLR